MFLRISKQTPLEEQDSGVENTEPELFKCIFKDAISIILEQEMDTVINESDQDPFFCQFQSSQGPELHSERSATVVGIKTPSIDLKSPKDVQDEIKTPLVISSMAKSQSQQKSVKRMTLETQPKDLLLDKSFMDVSHLVLENTVYNIIQEATYNEADLSKPSKVFIKPNPTIEEEYEIENAEEHK